MIPVAAANILTSKIVKWLITILVTIIISVGLTYSIVSDKYELKIADIKGQLAKAELDLEKERSAHQGALFKSAFEASQELTASLDKNRQQAQALSNTLGKAVLVTKDCRPSEEFKQIWNAASMR